MERYKHAIQFYGKYPLHSSLKNRTSENLKKLITDAATSLFRPLHTALILKIILIFADGNVNF